MILIQKVDLKISLMSFRTWAKLLENILNKEFD